MPTDLFSGEEYLPGLVRRLLVGVRCLFFGEANLRRAFGEEMRFLEAFGEEMRSFVAFGERIGVLPETFGGASREEGEISRVGEASLDIGEVILMEGEVMVLICRGEARADILMEGEVMFRIWRGEARVDFLGIVIFSGPMIISFVFFSGTWL